MECFVCYREYRLSPTGEALVFPKVGLCGHSVCNECCDKLHASSSDPKCPYCNRENSFEWQSRNFLAEDCLTVMENTDLVQSLLPQLKNLVVDLTERKKELDKEMNEAPKGLFPWLKWKMATVGKDKIQLQALQDKIDSLIDLTKTIIGPKMAVTSQPNKGLQIEVRSLESLEPDVLMFGPSVEISGCVWKMFIVKTIKGEESFFGMGVQMNCTGSTKIFRGSGRFTLCSQRREVDDYPVRMFGDFEAPSMRRGTTNFKPWGFIVSSTSGYYQNNRLCINCKEWKVEEVE